MPARFTPSRHQDDKPQDNAEPVKADGQTGDDKDGKQAETTSFTLHNLDRVTPSQLDHITFPSNGRYAPVRPIMPSLASLLAAARRPKKSTPLYETNNMAECNTAGGGIILLTDAQTGTAGEYHEVRSALDAPALAAPAPAAEASALPAQAASNAMDVDDGPELDMPPPFEVSAGGD